MYTSTSTQMGNLEVLESQIETHIHNLNLIIIT